MRAGQCVTDLENAGSFPRPGGKAGGYGTGGYRLITNMDYAGIRVARAGGSPRMCPEQRDQSKPGASIIVWVGANFIFRHLN